MDVESSFGFFSVMGVNRLNLVCCQVELLVWVLGYCVHWGLSSDVKQGKQAISALS